MKVVLSAFLKSFAERLGSNRTRLTQIEHFIGISTYVCPYVFVSTARLRVGQHAAQNGVREWK